jgi:hypothetical protein
MLDVSPPNIIRCTDPVILALETPRGLTQGEGGWMQWSHAVPRAY